MKVLLINTYEQGGGAAIAANRLMKSLCDAGVDARMLVARKSSADTRVTCAGRRWQRMCAFVWERAVIWLHNRLSRRNLFAVSIASTGFDVTRLPEFRQADIIHLHWVNQGMLSLRGLERVFAAGKPVVWTMHDMWPCTGICHHARQCDRYRQECGECPFLYGKKHKHDLANRVFRQKKEIYAHYPITFVTCSHWLEEQARQSALTVGRQIVCIPNPLNTNLFRPHNKQTARQRLQLPMDRKLILFGAFKITDKRKGIDYMVDACKLLAGQHPELKEQMAVVTFGRQSAQVAEMLPFKVYPLDYVNDEHRLVDMYNAADLFVTPSLEENLPNTIMEAMACGTPCVGFNVGGIPEMIDHLHNGYVAIYKSADDFANGIYWALTEPDYDSLCEQACRKAVSHYSEDSVAKRYIDLYNKLTERR